MDNTTNKPIFSAGADEAYAALPVDVAYLRWRRGNANLRPLAKDDPAIFLGGWLAMVHNRDGEDLPTLPLPVVERTSEDGQVTFEVYATPILRFLPINHRTRWDKRGKKTDPQTGREKTVILAVSKKKPAAGSGFEPNKQIFGLVFDKDGNRAPAVLILDKWSSFITFQRAEQKFAKVKVPDDHALIRRYGTEGINDNGKLMPEFEVMGESRSTPIQAVKLDDPTFVAIDDEMTRLFYDSVEWAECEKWNAESNNPVEEAAAVDTAMSKFLNACTAIGLTNVEIEQILKENDNNYAKALEALEGGETLTSLEQY